MFRDNLLFPVLLVAFMPLAGCSEAVPPAAEGAFQVNISSGASPADCGLDITAPITMGLVGPTSHDRLEKDTLNDAQVFCTVKQQGSAFSMEGYAAMPDSVMEFQVSSITADANEGNPAFGRVTVAGPATALNAMTSPDSEPCSFYFVNEAQRSQLAPGRAWFSFRCPSVEDVSINRSCGIDTSYAAFQNCEQ
ncbi:MAG: hypothetical protein JRI23_06475 [Deltaproteobacteria bacterium]|jgi:hypothetical protein|nr:hypothetical protein [Deltaproteobacteria bacterium]MBW2531224.1 hypothetical protein [Deltaproteobacteria bacterium]